MIIAERTLTARMHSGPDKPVPIRLYAPEPEDGGWRCRYEIDWPEDGVPPETVAGRARGEDSFAALQYAIQKLSIELLTSRYHRNGALGWFKPGTGLGLIPHRDARDLLQGDDIATYGCDDRSTAAHFDSALPGRTGVTLHRSPPRRGGATARESSIHRPAQVAPQPPAAGQCRARRCMEHSARRKSLPS